MSESPHNAIPRPSRATARVVIGVLTAPEIPALAISKAFARWRQLIPLAAWLPIELSESSPASILLDVTAALDRSSMTQRQLILLGEGPVARSALELVLQGELSCGGIVAVDVSCDAPPFRIMPTISAIRLVVHYGCAEPRRDLIDSLRAADLDARVINLDLIAGRSSTAAANATETFILELVATISRRTSDGVAAP